MINDITISNEDVIQLILQFMKENNLKESFKQIEAESGIRYGYVTEDIGIIRNDIVNGNWDRVLKALECVSLKKETLFSIYEIIIMELVEAKEYDIAKCLLFRLSSEVTNVFKFEFKAKFDLLNQVINKDITSAMYYSSLNVKEGDRAGLAKVVIDELTSILPGRLIYLLGQGVSKLAYADKDKKLSYNLFNGKYMNTIEEASSFAKTKSTKCINLNKDDSSNDNKYNGSYVTCAHFSLKGDYLATGSNDGLIELWDTDTFEQSQKVQYQVEGNLMFHTEAIASLSFSKDSQLICAGDVVATIKVFAVSSGRCLGTFTNVHSKAITSVNFTHSNDLIISASLDGTIAVIGLRSMKIISEIKAHSSFINSCSIYWGNDAYYTASSDGSAKIWNVRDSQLIQTIVINEDKDKSLNGIKANSKGDAMFISNQTNSIFLIDNFGSTVKTFKTERKGSIALFEVSHDDNWLYCIDENNLLYTFNTEHCVIVNLIDLGKGKEIIGMVLSPMTGVLGIYSNDGLVSFYSPTQ